MPDDIIELFGQQVRIVDLSRSLGSTLSEPTPPKTHLISHEDCAQMWELMFGIPPTVLPLGLGFAGEIVEASTHASTHLDAPWHYAPVSENEPAWTIDQIPLQWFIGSIVVLDVSDLPTGHLVTVEDIKIRLARLQHTIRFGEIVLFCTGADAVWGTEAFFSYGCGLGEEGVLYLIDQGVRVIGTDAWSLDRPYPLIGQEWETYQDPKLLWPAHFTGIKQRYSQIEKLTNLKAIPPIGSTILCFPIKVERGSGAWSRVVALVPSQ